MTLATWIDWKNWDFPKDQVSQVYFGHETCQHLLPPERVACHLARELLDHDWGVTLVTPFLTEYGLWKTLHLVERLADHCGKLEVVSSDWGLLYELATRKLATPVAGRLLSGQLTDPRLARQVERHEPGSVRFVSHLDGTVCEVRWRQPSQALLDRLCSCTLGSVETVDFLMSLGISRCELNNLSQGLRLESIPGWSYSLHLSDVLVAVMRHCPGMGEDFRVSPRCSEPASLGKSCSDAEQWSLPGNRLSLFRRANGLYSNANNPPVDLEQLPIDRLVFRPVNGVGE